VRRGRAGGRAAAEDAARAVPLEVDVDADEAGSAGPTGAGVLLDGVEPALHVDEARCAA
jgi:hypothetical protein